jgi:integrase
MALVFRTKTLQFQDRPVSLAFHRSFFAIDLDCEQRTQSRLLQVLWEARHPFHREFSAAPWRTMRRLTPLRHQAQYPSHTARGLRASEVCGLRWDQIDLNSGRLHVRRAKGGIDNVHPLSGKEIRALRQLRRENTESRYVFVTERGGPATTGSRSISFSVRYSLGRSSELGALLGTVRFTMVERAGFRADFAM